MALQRQLIPLSFGQGIDTKPDKKQQGIGKLRRAKNVVFETLFSARKRNGYDSILLETTDGVEISSAKVLTSFKRELNLFDAEKLYSFSESLQKLQPKGSIYNIFPSSGAILNNSYNHDSLDVVYVEGLSTYVYHNTIINDVRYSVQDQTTKSLIVSDDVVATGAVGIRVANIQNIIYMLYIQGTALKYRKFNILTPDVLEAAVTIDTDVDTAAPLMDVVSGVDKLVVVYNSTQVGAKLKVFSILSDGTETSSIGITGADATRALDVFLDSGNRIVISYSDNTKVAYTIFPYNLTSATLASTTLETIAAVVAITGIEVSSNTYRFYYQVAATDSVNDMVKQNSGTLAGVIGSPTVFNRGVGLASKAYTQSDLIYVPLAFETTLQCTYFLMDENGVISAKWNVGTGGGHITTGVLSTSIQLSDTEWLIASQVKGKLVSENGTFYGLLGINGTVLDYDIDFPYETAVLGNNMHIAGGILQMYDGDSVVEHGFNVYPENLVTMLQTTTTAGGLVPGSYGYKAVYRWTDNEGLEHRSADSLDTTVDFVSSSVATGSLAVIAPVQVSSVTAGPYRNGDTVTVVVAAAAANPTNTVLAVVGGTEAAVTLTITPNNGTNNSGATVTLTTAELAELITGGTVTGKTVTLTDTNSLLVDLTATGGSASNIVAGSYATTLAGGTGLAPTGSLATTVPIVLYSRTVGPTKNGVKVSLEILAAAANPTNTILADFTGTAANITLTITPNDGTNNGAVPVNMTTAQVAELINFGAVVGKSITVTDASILRPEIRAEGGGPQNVVNGGEGDGLAVTLQSGALVTSYAIQVPTLRLTRKTNVVIELYRTEDDGTIYYLVSSTASPTFNNKTVDTVTITDTVSDTELISRQTLYTTGGVLSNIAPLPASIVAVHTASNRVMLLQDNQVQYSKIHQTGQPVEFNDDFVIPVDPVGGNLVAGISMDDKFIIFESDATFYISGSGPLNTGEQDTFTQPEILASDVGCIDPRSVVYTPIGVLFKSRKGIYKLSHSLTLDYIGAPVEEYNGLTISSAEVIGELNQVRFTTSDGDCLVYNYNLDLWCTFDNHKALSAEVIGNDYWYIRANNELYKENRTKWADNGTPIRLLLETAWISFNVLQGFQRVYHAMVLGLYKSPHQLRIRAAYNFNEAYTQQKVIDPGATFINPGTYGEDSPYGSGSPYGGSGNVYQPRFAFKQQKSQSIKILIEDVQDTPGEGLSLSAITFEVAGKGGLFTVDLNNKFGVS